MNNLKISKVISFLLMVCLVGTFCISGISTAYAEETMMKVSVLRSILQRNRWRRKKGILLIWFLKEWGII